MPKFEQWKLLFLKSLNLLNFYVFLSINLQTYYFLNFFFVWKITNYADSFWFIYSSKKTLHELRYLIK